MVCDYVSLAMKRIVEAILLDIVDLHLGLGEETGYVSKLVLANGLIFASSSHHKNTTPSPHLP